MGLSFRILGPLEVWRDGLPVRLGPGKQRCLLTALLLEPNRVVAVDRLVSAIWDGEPPRSAIANVRTYASGLRGVLADDRGASRLAGRNPGYAVAVEEGELDLAVFSRLTRAGSTALAAGRAVEAVEALGEAVALWRGSAAEDVCRSAALDRWLTALDEQRLATIEDWVEARQMLSDDGGLVGDLRRLTGDYPLRERMWRGLVLALYRAGDVSGALAAFRQAREAIVEDLGVEPGPELTWLHEAVLARDPALDGRARSAPSDGAADPQQEPGGASPTRMTIHLELESVDLADVTERLTLAFGDLASGRRPAEGGLR